MVLLHQMLRKCTLFQKKNVLWNSICWPASQENEGEFTTITVLEFQKITFHNFDHSLISRHLNIKCYISKVA